MKLYNMVTLAGNNDSCVLLEVKDGQRMNLIALGCFTGDEKLLRLTKGRTVTCTVFTDHGSYAWSWGFDGFTLVSDQTFRKGQLIQECIERDFGIRCKF